MVEPRQTVILGHERPILVINVSQRIMHHVSHRSLSYTGTLVPGIALPFVNMMSRTKFVIQGPYTNEMGSKSG